LNIPLSPALYRDLEKRIRKGYSVDPIPVWRNYILTGYERYELSERLHRNYRITDMYFTRKHEAHAWICRQQLKRKDLHRQAFCWLIFRLYTALLELQKQQSAKVQFEYKRLSPSFRSQSGETPAVENTALLKTIGEEFGYHLSTVRSYVRYGRQLDQLEAMFPGVRLRILKGEIEVPITYSDALLQMPKSRLEQMISDPKCRRLVPPENVRKKILTARSSRPRKTVHVNTGIKKTPAYDPDAELNQLTYTIGTWSRTINRTRESADFRGATENGRENLSRALRALSVDMKNLSEKLEAEIHE
jgi:hypothetical protein